MFFVSYLLNQVLGWMRKLPGTTSLRAMSTWMRFSVISHRSPTRRQAALLTLLKQARAFGVGWFWRHKTPWTLTTRAVETRAHGSSDAFRRRGTRSEFSKALKGCGRNRKGFGRADMDKIIAGLGNRVFLVNNVHEDRPEVFETRWALSYLAGPLTRTQIKLLMDPTKQTPTPHAPEPATTVKKIPFHFS